MTKHTLTVCIALFLALAVMRLNWINYMDADKRMAWDIPSAKLPERGASTARHGNSTQ
jgi:hypothetical protein